MARPHSLAIALLAGTLLASPLLSSARAQPAGVAAQGQPAPQEIDPLANQDDRVSDDELRALVDQLNDQDIKTRDHAQFTLATSNGVDLERIEDYLDTANLSPEQHLRLSAVGFALFDKAPRPAMGVEFGTRFSAVASVTINNTVPGFDAANSLIPGDVILRMDGIPVQNFDHARQIILSFDPFDQITISVLRNGEPIDAVVRFGSFAKLPNPSAPSSEILREAWSIRRARRAPDRAERIVVALDPSLRPRDPVLAPQVAQQAWRAVETWISRRFEGAGELLDARFDAYARAQQDAAGPNVVAAGANRVVDMAATEPFNDRPVTLQIAAELRVLDGEINRLMREQADGKRRLADPNLRADERNRLSNRVRALDAELMKLRQTRRKYLAD